MTDPKKPVDDRTQPNDVPPRDVRDDPSPNPDQKPPKVPKPKQGEA